MCGGSIEVNSDMTIGTCQYCGSTMTLPRIDSDKKARLFNMANQYRLNNEFDRAYDAYHDIAAEDENEAEAYWGMLLSEYGVEYVEDPKTNKRVPTCHRTSVNSIMNSVNYELALKHTDIEGKMLYRDEALQIDTLQKKILSVSLKEEPYDIFICYKETDNSGERTEDSVLAQEIYDRLLESGYKVFFSRITLKDKLGEDYEPYIYSALKSAKLMLLVTTSYENACAVWVKNEWMRYIGFMCENANKTLIPVCKGMKAVELPNELNRYQAQEMDKIGAMQDLLSGVKSLISSEERNSRNDILNALINEKIQKDEEERQEKIRRAEEEKLSKIREQKEFRQKLKMVNIGIKLFATAIVMIIIAVIAILANRYVIQPAIKYRKTLPKYNVAVEMMDNGKYDEAIEAFVELGEFKDNDEKIKECNYLRAMKLYNEEDYAGAYAYFECYEDYSDSLVYMKECAYKVQLDRAINEPTWGDSPYYVRFVDEMTDEQLYSIAKAYYDNDMQSRTVETMAHIDDYETNDLYIAAMDYFYDIANGYYDGGYYYMAKSAFEFPKSYNYKDSVEKYEDCVARTKY
jgi:TolA-binding protein